MATKTKNTETTTFTANPATLRRYRQLARELGLSYSATMRRAMNLAEPALAKSVKHVAGVRHDDITPSRSAA